MKSGFTRFRPLLASLALMASVAAFSARAELQFDVFLGFDGIVPEANWFPVVCELKNDGPPFIGVVEISAGMYEQGQTRRVAVELPTGTLKRLVVPVFSSTRYVNNWEARLYDERGKLRGQQLNVQPRRRLSWESPLFGALSRTAGGAPVFQPILPKQPEWQPVAARLQPTIFPDNPLVLDGLHTLYLNSEKASELRASQVEALRAWLYSGGHLIVAVEQISDVNSVPWLRSLFPCDLTETRTVGRHPELQEWLRAAYSVAGVKDEAAAVTNTPPTRRITPPTRGTRAPRMAQPADASPPPDLSDDPSFEAASLQVAIGPLRDGRALVTAQDTPLIVTADRGRGRVTGLMFSPEREPTRAWRQLPWLWSRLGDVPKAWYTSTDFNNYYNEASSDGIFGAMIDSKQVRKLPVGWLLFLLLVYLVVIGPLDQSWLKRINRPMLTWLTFPAYVVLFSVSIYFIGYKLRAGETEWNELHIVDVLPRGERSELRGHTYASIYSPANETYKLQGRERFATLRGEFAGWGGGQGGARMSVLQQGDNFQAEVFVPVWTSQLLASDWWQPAPPPLTLAVTPGGDGWKVAVENHLDRKLTHVQVVVGNRIVELADLEPGQSRTSTVTSGQGMSLIDYVARHGGNFQSAAGQRQHAFGSTSGARIDDVPNGAAAVSFISKHSAPQQYQGGFLVPAGLDLSPLVDRGQAILLAWAADYSPVQPMNQFTPRRAAKNTLLRVATEMKNEK